MNGETARDGEEDEGESGRGSGREGIFYELRELFRVRGRREPRVTLRTIVEEVIEEHEEGEQILSEQERLILLNLAKLRERSVADVMVPRADIVAVAETTPIGQLLALFRGAAHSRLPVYRKTLDAVTGMVHIKDVVRVEAERRPDRPEPGIPDFKRDVLFVPPSMPVLDLLIKMRESRIHMAVVVDEYGGTGGLATIEDVVEQVVGDIEDEHDPIEEKLIVARPGGVIEAAARAPLADLEALLGAPLLIEARDEDIETVGGLVVALAGRVPQRGELIRHHGGVEFEVLDADPRRLKKLRVRRPGEATANSR